MPDPTDPPTDTAPATTEPAAPSADTAASAPLTLEMVRALIAEESRKAHDAGAAAARRAMEGKAAKGAATQPPRIEATPPAATAGDSAGFAEDLADAISEYPLDKEQRRTIRDLARTQRPEDVDAFVAHWARMFGKSPGAVAAPTQQTQPAQAPKPPSIPNTLPPAGTTPDGGATPVFRALSEADRADAMGAYIRRHGGNPANMRAPETRKALSAMRRDFEAAAAITDVQIGARPTR